MTSPPQSLDIPNQDAPQTPPRTQSSDGGAVQGTQATEQATPGALLGQSSSVDPGTHPEHKNTPDTTPMVPESTASDPLQAGDETSSKGGGGEGQVPDSPPQSPPPLAENVDSAGSPVDDKNKEKVEDKGSTSTANTRTPTSRSSRRKADKSSASEGAPSSLTVNASSVATNGKPNVSTPSRRKPSFIGKLMRKLMPCIASSSRAHEIDVDGETSLVVKEKAVVKDTEGDAQPEPAVKSQDVSNVEPPSPLNNLPTGAMPLMVAPLPPPPKSDAELIVPPTSQLLPGSETAGLTSGAVQPPGSTGDGVHGTHHGRNRPVDAVDGDESDGSSFTEDEDAEERHHTDAAEDDEDMLVENGGAGIPIGPDGIPRPLLPPVAPHNGGRKCLVLDLDETLVHSSFKSIQQADYVVPVEIEYLWHNVYVIKRPGVDNFLKKMGEIYEVVVFTASLSKYADPVLDKLDIHQVVSHRLFRDSCYNHRGNYVKDLSQLGRPIADTIILDNSPASYIFHPNNAVPVSSWFNDPHDTELTDLVPFLADLSSVDDVRGVLDGGL